VKYDDVNVESDTDETSHHRNVYQRASRQLKLNNIDRDVNKQPSRSVANYEPPCFLSLLSIAN